MSPDEREWQAQERAMHMDRLGLDVVDADGPSAGYLSIARALRQRLDAELPADFADRMAGLVAARGKPVQAESRFEQGMLIALGVIMGLSALVSLIAYGSSDWLSPVTNSFSHIGRPTLTWPLALLACLSVSWLTQFLRQQGPNDRRHLA